MAVALQKLKEKYADSRVYGVAYWKVAHERLEKIREAGPHGWGHAGEMETSMMLVIRPDLVKEERGGLDGSHPESVYGDQVSQFLRIDEMTEQGVYGDPSFGTKEKGERMLDAAAETLEFVEAVTTAPNVVAAFCGHVHFAHADAINTRAVQYVGAPGFEGGRRLVEFRPL